MKRPGSRTIKAPEPPLADRPDHIRVFAEFAAILERNFAAADNLRRLSRHRPRDRSTKSPCPQN